MIKAIKINNAKVHRQKTKLHKKGIKPQPTVIQ
jgi:hypothetical protein